MRKKYYVVGLMLVLILIYVSYSVHSHVLTPKFEFINNTNHIIKYNNLQVTIKDSEPTDEELEGFNVNVVVNSGDSFISRVYPRNLKTKEKFSVGFEFRGDGTNVNGLSFGNYPTYEDQVGYCGYQIEVYEDNIIVKPSNQRHCFNKMYYSGEF